MRFYENGELVATLNNDEAIEHCLRCLYCCENEDGSHICALSHEPGDLEEELASEDDNQLECWLS